MPLRPRPGQVLVPNCVGQINTVDIRQGAQPGQHVREFFLQVFSRGSIHRLTFGTWVGAGLLQCGGQFSDLFHEPHERGGSAAEAVGMVVSVMNVLLEIAQGKRQLVQGLAPFV